MSKPIRWAITSPRHRDHLAPMRQRGSILVIVLITLMFTVLALTAFIDKASTDLIVDTRDTNNLRMRQEAYSALEATLAVLANFREIDGALRSPIEGWGDPLTFAAWTPSEGRTVEVTFEDETAKIPLPRADSPTLINLFENWGMVQNDAERLSDALLNWMKQDYVGSSSFTPDYDTGAISFGPPARSLRSFSELSTIDVARDMFFDPDGRPNDFYRRFTDSVSLFNFAKPNLNTAKTDVLVALANFDATQQQQLNDYLTGAGNFLSQGPAYFRSAQAAAAVLGQTANTNGFDVQIRALRVHVVVHEGRNVYRLDTVIAPSGGATTVRSSATNTTSGANSQAASSASSSATATATSSGSTSATSPQASSSSSSQGITTNGSTNNSTSTTPKLNYPFTVLEIRENNEPQPVAAPPPSTV